MARDKSFEELALEYRAKSRERYSKGLSEIRGPAPFSKTLTEPEQDEMWAHADQQYVDPPEVTAAVQQAVQQATANTTTPTEYHAAVQQAVQMVAQQYPQSAFLRLMLPQEMGGQGMTPLQASYTKHPNRQLLVEGAGKDIEDQIKYADMRQKRLMDKPVTPDGAPAEPAQQVMGTPMTSTSSATDYSAQFSAPEQPSPAVGGGY